MSTPTPVFIGKVDTGKIKLNEHQKFCDYVRIFEGKFVELVVRLPRKDRSNQQNRYYFGVVVKILSEYTGFTTDEIHEVLKEKFLSKIIVLAGKDERITRSSTELSTVEWENWMTQIREWAAQELSVVIPEPNEIDLEENEE